MKRMSVVLVTALLVQVVPCGSVTRLEVSKGKRLSKRSPKTNSISLSGILSPLSNTLLSLSQ